ncbi:MAG: sporulation integral membrane protein YtvI, partial [Clostridia bacterium]
LIEEGLTIPKEIIGKVGSYTASAAGSLPAILLFILAVLVATYFFSSDYHKISAYLRAHMPAKWRNGIVQTRTHFIKTLLCYIRALAILLCLTFVELSIGFSILGIKYSIVLAFFVAFIDAFPILGTGTVLIPWAIISLISGNISQAVGLAIIYGVITIIRNVIEPKIVGQQIGLHPLVTLASIYIGIKVFGVVGIFTPILVVFIKQMYEWGYFDALKSGKAKS